MPAADVHALFARRLRQLAEQKGISLADLARQAGIDDARLDAYLSGEESAELDHVAALARVLDVQPPTLLREE